MTSINLENVEARLEAQFSRIVPVLGQEAADILLEQSMAIIRDEAKTSEDDLK